jgi:hypothetical protein
MLLKFRGVTCSCPEHNARFLHHHSYYDLATITVYTKGKTPEETCEEILERIKGNL